MWLHGNTLLSPRAQTDRPSSVVSVLDRRAVKRLILDRSTRPEVRAILENLLLYQTRDPPASPSAPAAPRLSAFHLLRSKFLKSAPRPVVTRRREVGSLTARDHCVTDADGPRDKPRAGMRRKASRVQDMLDKFAAVAENKDAKKRTHTRRTSALNSIIRAFETLNQSTCKIKKHNSKSNHSLDVLKQHRRQTTGTQDLSEAFSPETRERLSSSPEVWVNPLGQTVEMHTQIRQEPQITASGHKQRPSAQGQGHGWDLGRGSEEHSPALVTSFSPETHEDGELLSDSLSSSREQDEDPRFSSDGRVLEANEENASHPLTGGTPAYRSVSYCDPSATRAFIPKTIRFTDTFNF